MVHTYRFYMRASFGENPGANDSTLNATPVEILLSYNSEPLQANESLAQIARYLLNHVFTNQNSSLNLGENLYISLPVFQGFLESIGERLFATWVGKHTQLTVHMLSIDPDDGCIWIIFN